MGAVAAILGIIACLFGMYREGHKSGYDSGFTDGATSTLAAFADGSIRIKDGYLFLGGMALSLDGLDADLLNDTESNDFHAKETER